MPEPANDVVFNTDSPNLVFWVSIVVGITEISAVVAAVGVLVGVIYYVLQLRHQSVMRQTDFIMKLYSTYGSKEFHDTIMDVHNLQFSDFEDFEKKYGPYLSKGSAQTAVFVVATYFTEWDVLLHRKIVDVDFLYDIFGSYAIKWHWEAVKPVVLGVRERLHYQGVFYYFEYLYNEMEKREQRGARNG